ncbi:hypothetical protein RN001_002726 [Aquatica leii]|uniref:DUF4806 domain-containing protein n=1 Tax=Aquatica leii TaxID=1421715 RepID=A0AAN7SSW3_9COLE|nr:hypothetical protein RN001_002726 [Aquatica leii]
MAQLKTWTVVRFLSENSVEAVPTYWIKFSEKKCYWSPYKSPQKLTKAISNQEAPSDNWDTYSVEFFQGSGNYESYEVAVEKCEAAKYESDLNSDIDNIALQNNEQRKRTSFPPKRYLISSSDEERSESDLQRSPSPLKKKRITVISNKMITPPLPPTPSSSSLFLGKDRSSSSTNTADCVVPDDVPLSLPQYNDNLEQNKTVVTTSRTCESCNSILNEVKAIKAVVLKIYHKQCITDQLQKQLSDDVNNGIKMMEKCNNPSINTKSFNLFDQVELPANTQDMLNQWELFLEITENYTSSVTQLSAIGGNTLYDFIKRLLSKIMKDSVAQNFNMSGRNNKNNFKETKTFKLLLDAAKTHRSVHTEKDVEIAVGSWLRRAKERHEQALKSIRIS